MFTYMSCFQIQHMYAHVILDLATESIMQIGKSNPQKPIIDRIILRLLAQGCMMGQA